MSSFPPGKWRIFSHSIDVGLGPTSRMCDLEKKRQKECVPGKKHMHPDAHSSTIYNSQHIKATEMSINRWIYITCVYAQFCLCNPWTVACQVPLFMGFFRQEYWSGLPFPPPGDCLNPGTELMSLASPAFSGGVFTTASPGSPYIYIYTYSRKYAAVYMLSYKKKKKRNDICSNVDAPRGYYY